MLSNTEILESLLDPTIFFNMLSNTEILESLLDPSIFFNMLSNTEILESLLDPTIVFIFFISWKRNVYIFFVIKVKHYYYQQCNVKIELFSIDKNYFHGDEL